MISLPDYTIFKEIYISKRRILCKGVRNRDQMPVIIKTHSPSPEILNDNYLLKHEYMLLKVLNGNGFPKPYALEKYPDGLTLILEYIEGQPLSEYLDINNIDLSTFLDIAPETWDESLHLRLPARFGRSIICTSSSSPSSFSRR